mgnify:FL=1
MKDKIGTVDAGDMAIEDVVSTPAGGAAAETLAALQSLGYAEQEVLPAIQKYAGQYDNVEDLLKIVLRTLGSGR